MPSVFRILGALWVCIGILNVVMYFDGDPSHDSPEQQIVVNALVFGLPGMILIGLGEVMTRRGRGQNK